MLRVVAVGQPPGVVERGIEVREDDLLKKSGAASSA
jgi:hypothetical protein